MTGYYTFWVFLIGLSLLASLGGFLWAYRHKQFTGQERARYLPFRGETVPILAADKHVGREVIAMAIVLLLGLLGIAATLLTVLFERKGFWL